MTEHRCLYAVVPYLLDVPPLDALNMPHGLPVGIEEILHYTRPNGTYPVDLVVAWNPEEAAHIEAVTGYRLQLGEPPVYYPTAVRWIDAAGTAQGLLPVGEVAARFHVTGCHRIGDGLCHCDTPWALYDYGLWHWTGHVEKVQP